MQPLNGKNGHRFQLESIRLDLHTHKARLYFCNKERPLDIHFDKPSRKFYFSLICLIVNEMKESDKPEFVYIRKHEAVLRMLDQSLAGANASKNVTGMWDKIRKAWRHRLPDLETGALFKVLDRKYVAPYEKGGKFRYECPEVEFDTWANLFSYDPNNPWRLKFAVDSVGIGLDDISIISGDLRDDSAWQEYIGRLKKRPEDRGGEIQVTRPGRKKTAIALTIALVSVVLAAVLWNAQRRSDGPTAARGDPEQVSLAILPFVNLSGDPQQAYFSDGITDDLITDLSKISGIRVISRNSTFAYKGRAEKAGQIAADLGVRYILEGSVRKVGDTIRINAQLIDATTDHHLWAERYDGKLDDIFGLQDRITQKIVASLAVQLTENEKHRLSLRETASIEAYEAYLQGREHQQQDTREDLARAVTSFKKATELDPAYSEAHAALSLAYQHIAGRAWDRELGMADARSLVRKHLDLAMRDPTPLAHRIKSRALLYYEHRHADAIDQAEQALALDPNDADNLFYLARALSFAGRHADALDYYEKAMRLNPYYPGWYPQHYGISLYCLERYEDAVKMQARAVRVNPNASAWWIAATYARLGEDDKAADLLNEYILKRGWQIVYVEATFKYWPFKALQDLDRFAVGLAMAGLPRPHNPAYRRKYAEAIALAEQAIAARPDDAGAHRMMAESLILSGRTPEALDFIKRATSLEPDNSRYLDTLGLAQFCLEQYEAAVISLEAFSSQNDDHIPGWLLATAYALAGRQKKAEKALADHIKDHRLREYTVERVVNTYLYAFQDDEVVARFVQGLQKAGLPGGKRVNMGE